MLKGSVDVAPFGHMTVLLAYSFDARQEHCYIEKDYAFPGILEGALNSTQYTSISSTALLKVCNCPDVIGVALYVSLWLHISIWTSGSPIMTKQVGQSKWHQNEIERQRDRETHNTDASIQSAYERHLGKHNIIFFFFLNVTILHYGSIYLT